MRAKLLDFSGNQTEEMVLRNTFREFDLNENGVLTADELQALLVRLQMSVERKYLTALLPVRALSPVGRASCSPLIDRS